MSKRVSTIDPAQAAKEARKFRFIGFFLNAAASMLPQGTLPKKKPRQGGGWMTSHQGERQKGRRLRQIAQGSLREQNGLVRS